MSENVSEVNVDLNDATVVENILEDADLRKLPVGSDAFKAALSEKMSKTDENVDTPAGDDDTDEVSDDEETDDTETDENADEAPQKKPKRGMLKRIEELVKERSDLEQRLAAYEASQKVTKTESTAPAHDTFDKPKPKFEQFDSIEDYTDAMTDWKLEKREHEANVAKAEQESKVVQDEILEKWNTREAAAKKEYADYGNVVTVKTYQKMSPSVEAQVFLAESEVGPQVVYHLMSDETLAEQFANANPVKQVAMLTRLEMKLDTGDKSTKETTVTKAPAPPRAMPKGKSVAQTKDINDPNLSFAEFDALMRERERAKRK